jgi:hypothetical protein
MVDLAIASNFARELTEDQFAAERRPARRGAPSRGTNGAAVGTSDRRPAPRRQGTPAPRRAGFGATRLGRTLARLVHVRG